MATGVAGKARPAREIMTARMKGIILTHWTMRSAPPHHPSKPVGAAQYHKNPASMLASPSPTIQHPICGMSQQTERSGMTL